MAKANNMMRDFLLAAHPVGSYYWSSESTSPATLFGGTWEQVKDCFVYAAGTKSAGTTGGEETHMLTITELPGSVLATTSKEMTGLEEGSSFRDVGVGRVNQFCDHQSALNNMPPYIVAYCWRRLA
jgi:hypothetical protein